MRGEGPIQRGVIQWLQQHPELNAREIARLVYSRDPTANEFRSVSNAVSALIRKGFVERSQYYHNGPCYRVTEKARARPDRPSLTRVK